MLLPFMFLSLGFLVFRTFFFWFAFAFWSFFIPLPLLKRRILKSCQLFNHLDISCLVLPASLTVSFASISVLPFVFIWFPQLHCLPFPCLSFSFHVPLSFLFHHCLSSQSFNFWPFSLVIIHAFCFPVFLLHFPLFPFCSLSLNTAYI